MKTGRFQILLITAFVLISFSNSTSINNGDWLRVTYMGGFSPEPWSPLTSSYPFIGNIHLGHSTTMGLIIGLIAAVIRDLSSSSFISALSISALYLIFISGLIRISNLRSIKHSRSLSFLLLLIYFFYGFYFKSFFEEASILAFLPWFCLGYFEVTQNHRFLIFNLSSFAIIYSKQQMIFLSPILIMLLIFHSLNSQKKRPILISAAVVLFATLSTLNSKHSSNRYPNQYNRYYNGIGWSWMNAHSWPAKTFNERALYFYNHQAALVQKLPQELDHEFIGTNFWPTGAALAEQSKSEISTSDPQKKNKIETLVDSGAIVPYLSYFIHHPKFVFQFIKNTYLITLQSDYSLEYIRTDVFMTSHFMKALQKTRAFLLGHIAQICAVSLLILVFAIPNLPITLVSLWFALMPIFVTMGDGYYEFEKHLVPFLMLIPFLVSVALSFKQMKHSK